MNISVEHISATHTRIAALATRKLRTRRGLGADEEADCESERSKTGLRPFEQDGASSFEARRGFFDIVSS